MVDEEACLQHCLVGLLHSLPVLEAGLEFRQRLHPRIRRVPVRAGKEIGSLPARSQPETTVRRLPPQPANGNGQPKLRDQLCLLIRQHRLDASLVKQYAAEFCGTKDLRQANREQVASFIKHIAEFAAQDKEELLAKLNSFVQQAGAA